MRTESAGAGPVERRGGLRIYPNGDVPVEAVLEALRQPGEVLKTSGKSRTRRVAGWVIKESAPGSFTAALRQALGPARRRRGWQAARHLAARGVHVPRPVAFVERVCWGLVTGSALVSEYLEGLRTVEAHAAAMAQAGADADAVRAFLSGLADAVNALGAAGAVHKDLSGKNVFTADGRTFYFIDLDGVTIGRPYTRALRLKNHVQLYDSFCDCWGDDYLRPFLERMLDPGQDAARWFDAVRREQAARRSHAETVGRRWPG